MLATLLAVALAAPDLEAPRADEGLDGGPPVPDAPVAAIWGGTEAPTSELDAVVALEVGGRSGTTAHAFCSGTLVDRAWVLTAAHCLRDVDRWRRDGWIPSVAIGPRGERERVAIDRAVVHPGYDPAAAPGTSIDLALVHLASDVDDVAPLRPSRTPLDDAWVGLPVSVLGYGVTASDRDDDGGVRRAADLFLAGVEDAFVRLFDGTAAWDDVDQDYDEVVWDGSSNACFGDSGGPALVRSEGAWVLVGVLSVVYPTCEHGGTGAIRVDDQLSWLGAHVPLRGTAALPPPPGAHGDEAWPGGEDGSEATSPYGASEEVSLVGCDARGGAPLGWTALAALALVARRRPTSR
jgi:secreted trypsin-like serine protease